MVRLFFIILYYSTDGDAASRNNNKIYLKLNKLSRFVRVVSMIPIYISVEDKKNKWIDNFYCVK